MSYTKPLYELSPELRDNIIQLGCTVADAVKRPYADRNSKRLVYERRFTNLGQKEVCYKFYNVKFEEYDDPYARRWRGWTIVDGIRPEQKKTPNSIRCRAKISADYLDVLMQRLGCYPVRTLKANYIVDCRIECWVNEYNVASLFVYYPLPKGSK